MSRSARLFLCIFLALTTLAASACTKPSVPAAQLTDDQLDELARTFVRFMAEAKPDDAAKMMDAKMAAAMPAAKVAETWQTLVDQAGAFDLISGARLTLESGYRCVYVTCKFSGMSLDAKVVFDADGKISGLWFGPSEVAEEIPYVTPAYADLSAFTESDCTVGTGEWALPGTLSMPKGEGPFPAVVLVHGSGPNDRDETVGANKPFKDIAWGLATKGIAVLRYDKRTKAYPAEMAAYPRFTVEDEVIDDALAAVSLLKETPGVNSGKVYVVGHSLGAMLAPRIAAKAGDSTTVAGLVMLAPGARNLVDLAVEQVEYLASLDGTMDDSESAQLQAVKNDAAKIRDGLIQVGEIVLGAPKDYWDDLLSYDPVATAGSLTIPALILQGERDYQVTMEDFALWSDRFSGSDGFALRSFPGLNHLFMPGEGASSPAEYQVQSNVDGSVIDAIAAWIKDVDGNER